MSWLYIPSPASNSSPASACSEKDCEPGSPTWASRIAPCATLSGKLTQPASWLRAWPKAAWMRHLSGPTLPPSTQQLGVERWIASLPDSHARICLSLGNAPDSTASAAACSSRSQESRTIAVRGSSFWRTSQASLLPPPPLWTKPKANSTSVRPPESWENWPTAGGMRNGSLFQRPTWEPATAGRGGSALRGAFWQTPKAGEEESGSGMNSRGEPKLKAQANNWETPKANDRSGRQTNSGGQAHLDVQANRWATPRATDGEKGGPNCRGGRGDPILAGQVCQWPTPTFQDGEQAGSSKANHLTLNRSVSLWPTPAARDHKGTNSDQHMNRTDGRSKNHADQLPNFVMYYFSHQGQTMNDGQESLSDTPTSRRHLNPLFGAWLMGWPSTWVIAEPHASSASATELWRSALQQQLSSLFGERESNKEAA